MTVQGSTALMLPAIGASSASGSELHLRADLPLMAADAKPEGLLASGQEITDYVVQAFLLMWAVTLSPPMGALLAIVTPFYSLVLSRILERHADAFKGYVRRFGGSKEKAREHNRRNRNTPNHREAIYWLFRMMQDAVDPSVVETLGYLTAVYSEANRRPDAQFRAIGRLLCELEPGEIHDLRVMLRYVEQSKGTDGRELNLLAETDQDGQERISIVPAPNEKMTVGQPVPSAARLLSLLKREGLGGTPGTPMTYGISEIGSTDKRVTISADQVTKLLEIIDGQPAKA
jgi:hypothetical protein